MSSYDYGFISNSEARELKEMIFRRVRERAEILAENGKNDYTDSMQREVMDIARESLRNSKNPFAPKNISAEEKHAQNKYEEIPVKKEENEQNFDINETKAKIEKDYQTVREYMAKDEISDMMDDASSNLRQRKSFIGALEFLNSKASQSLINKRSKGLDAIA